MRRHLRAFTVLFLIAGLLAWGAAPAAARPGRLILHRHAIPGRYIVVLKDGVNADAAADVIGDRRGFDAGTVYTDALSGFAALAQQPQEQPT